MFFVCQVFAGAARLTMAMVESGFRSLAYDKVIHPDMDVTSLGGLHLLLTWICRLREGSLLWLGPPCSMWCLPKTCHTGWVASRCCMFVS